MNMLHNLPEEIKMLILTYDANEQSAEGMLVDNDRIIDEIRLLDPEFSLASHLRLLLEKRRKWDRLMKSDAYKLYQVIGRNWKATYKDGALRIKMFDSDRFGTIKLNLTQIFGFKLGQQVHVFIGRTSFSYLKFRPYVFPVSILDDLSEIQDRFRPHTKFVDRDLDDELLLLSNI